MIADNEESLLLLLGPKAKLDDFVELEKTSNNVYLLQAKMSKFYISDRLWES